jgi:hypothetical protein
MDYLLPILTALLILSCYLNIHLIGKNLQQKDEIKRAMNAFNMLARKHRETFNKMRLF